MTVKKVSVPELGTVHLYKRRGARSMRLSISSQGDVRVSLPHWVPYATAVEFALQKRAWIESQQVEPDILPEGGRIGKAHRLVFVADPSRTTVSTRINNQGDIRIHHPAHMTYDHPTVQKAARRAGIRALRTQAEKLLPQRLQTLASQNDFTYNSVAIKQLKSRWGSCTNKTDIALSCYLMQLPWHLIDYVLLHELVHTRIMAHGPVFWEELEKYVPDLKSIRKEIREHRPVLQPMS